MAQVLEAAKIVRTLEQLSARISERFPKSGLAEVCSDLVLTARRTAVRARGVGRPAYLLRLLSLLTIAGFIAAQYYAVTGLHLETVLTQADPAALTQVLESAVNLLILAGVAIWFLITFEERIKRRRVHEYLHELRSFAHVVDMHQLTKDPTTILNRTRRTASSPTREMSQFELARYLDYCAEMLALMGKLAALYAERSNDEAINAAVNDIETLTSNLGRKIWQKIMILSQLDESHSEDEKKKK